MESIRALITVVTLALLATGCATPSSSGTVYSRHDTRTAWDVDYGHVKDIDTVRIEGEATEYGKIGGGYVGYEVGRSIGHGGGNGGHVEDVAGAAGAIAGALVGSAIEKAVTSENGYQITVELDGGRTIAIVQARDQTFDVGERVKVFSRRDGSARVAKL